MPSSRERKVTVGIDKIDRDALLILAAQKTLEEGKYVSVTSLVNRAVKEFLKKAKG